MVFCTKTSRKCPLPLPIGTLSPPTLGLHTCKTTGNSNSLYSEPHMATPSNLYKY